MIITSIVLMLTIPQVLIQISYCLIDSEHYNESKKQKFKRYGDKIIIWTALSLFSLTGFFDQNVYAIALIFLLMFAQKDDMPESSE